MHRRLGLTTHGHPIVRERIQSVILTSYIFQVPSYIRKSITENSALNDHNYDESWSIRHTKLQSSTDDQISAGTPNQFLASFDKYTY